MKGNLNPPAYMHSKHLNINTLLVGEKMLRVREGIHRFGLYQCDHDCVPTQTYNNYDESHNGGKVE